MFKDRIDTGRQLANALRKYRNRKDVEVMAIPRGGVVPGHIIARALDIPLEVVMIKKIGHPENREYAIGAVSMDGVILNYEFGIDKKYVDETVKKTRELLQEQYKLYYGGEHRSTVPGKTVIIVDDGVATGRTLMAAIDLIRQEKPAKIVVAIPVCTREVMKKIESKADEVFCLEVHDHFHSIGMYYEKFDQVSDAEVIRMLNETNNMTAGR